MRKLNKFNKRTLSLITAMCLLISTVTSLVANVESTMAAPTDPVREAFYQYLDENILPANGVATLGAQNWPADSEFQVGVTSVLFRDLDGDGTEEMIVVTIGNAYPQSLTTSIDIYKQSVADQSISKKTVSTPYHVDGGLLKSRANIFLTEFENQTYIGIENVLTADLMPGESSSALFQDFIVFGADGPPAPSLRFRGIRDGMLDGDVAIIDPEVERPSGERLFQKEAFYSRQRDTSFGSTSLAYMSDPGENLEQSIYPSFNAAYKGELAEFGFTGDWLGDGETVDGYTYSSIWDYSGINLKPMSERENGCTDIYSIAYDGTVSEVTLTDYTDWQNRSDEPGEDQYRLVEGYSYLYEVLNADETVKSPRQFIWVYDGGTGMVALNDIKVIGDKFYAQMEDTGVYVPIIGGAPRDIFDFDNAIWCGPDQKLGTADDMLTRFEDSGFYYLYEVQEDGNVWKYICDLIEGWPYGDTTPPRETAPSMDYLLAYACYDPVGNYTTGKFTKIADTRISYSSSHLAEFRAIIAYPTLAEMAAYGNYSLTLYFTLSEGITPYKLDGGSTYTGVNFLEPGNNPSSPIGSIVSTSDTNGATFKMEIPLCRDGQYPVGWTAAMKSYAGQQLPIHVYFRGLLNAGAVIYDPANPEGSGNISTAYMTYNDDPGDSESVGQTPEGSVKVYTFSFDATTVNAADHNIALDGAVYEIRTGSPDGTAIPLLHKSGNIYTLSDGSPGTVTSITTDASGKFYLQGLDNLRHYYLAQTQAPAGYALPENPISLMQFYIVPNGDGTAFESIVLHRDSEPQEGYSILVENEPLAAPSTVILDKQGGTGGTSSVMVTYGASMPPITVPSYAGFNFAGYYDAASGGTQYYTAAGASARTWDKDADATLYARWTAEPVYTVTFDKQGGTDGSSSVTAKNGAAMPSAAMPTRTGYIFTGYYDAASGGTQYYTAAGASARAWDKANEAMLYARWAANTYTVTLDRQGGTSGSNSVTATYDAAMPTPITLPTRTGYTFQGYYDAISGGTQYYTATGTSARTWDKADDATLYARWTAIIRTVTYDTTTNGGQALSGVPVQVAEGASVDLSKTATKPGWEFVGWSTNKDATTGLASLNMGNSDVTLYAIYKKTLTATFIDYNGTTKTTRTAEATLYNNAISGSIAEPTQNTFTGWTPVGWTTGTAPIAGVVKNPLYISADTTFYGLYERTLTLSYNANGGSSTPGSQSGTQSVNSYANTVFSSLSLTLAPAISRSGYTFNKWAKDSATGTQYATGASIAIDKDTTMYAVWEAAEYTVTLDRQGGTGGAVSVTATYDAVMPAVTMPTRTGYTFAGYYDAESGGTQYYTAAGASTRTWNKTSNAMLYAQWTADTYEVTLDRQDGTGGSSSVIATYDAAMPVITLPYRTGYTFAGYYDATSGGTQYYTATGASAKTWNKASATTLYARWTASTFMVTFDKQGGAGGLNSITVTFGENMPAATMPTRTGYTFAGYYDAATGGTQYYTATGASTRTWNKANDATLYSKWTASPVYTVNFDKQGGTGGSSSVTVTFGETMPAITLPTRLGYSFAGYHDATVGGTQYYASTGASTIPWNKDTDATLYARWTANTHIVTYNTTTNGGQTLSGPTTVVVAEDAAIDLSKTATKPGWEFVGWNTNKDATLGLTSLKIGTNDVTLYAIYKKTLTATFIDYSGNTKTTRTAAATIYNNATSGNVTAPAQNAFTGWSPRGWGTGTAANAAVTYAGNQSVNISANTTFYGLYQKTLTLSYNANGGGTTPNSQSGTQYVNSYANTTYGNPSLTLASAITRSGYSFSKWAQGSASGTQYAAGTNITISTGTTMYAVWTKASVGPLLYSERYGFSNSHFSFFGHHSNKDGCSYVMTDNDFNKLANYARKLYPSYAQSLIDDMQESRVAAWGGSCYGMSISAILDKTKQVNFKKHFGPKATLRELSAPNANPALRSAINYYQNSWRISWQWAGTFYNKNDNVATWTAGVKEMVDCAKAGKVPILLCYYWGDYGHAVVVNEYRTGANGSHQLVCYDNRYPDRDFIINVSGDYKNVSTDLLENAYEIAFQTDFTDYDKIDFDGPNNDFALSAPAVAAAPQGALLTFAANGVTSIANAEGETLRYDSATGVASGNMQVFEQGKIPNSTADGQAAQPTVILEVPDSDVYAFTSDGSGVDDSVIAKDIYASAYSKKADKITITKGKGIDITGKGAFEYTASLGLNNSLCDMVKIDSKTNDAASLYYKDGGVVIKGLDGNAKLTVFSETVNIKETVFETEYNEVFITGDGSGKPGAVDIRASSKGDGIYDISLLKSTPGGNDPGGGNTASQKMVLTDTATGVAISAEAGRIPEGTKLSVCKIKEGKVQDDEYATLFGQGAYVHLYDITLTKDGKRIQPTGSVTVKLPLPADYTTRGYGLYYVNSADNRYQQIVPRIEGGSAVFEADHFSVYGFVSKGTGDGGSGNETSPSSDQERNSFFDGQGKEQPQPPPKTGVGIDGKMVALLIVILLDVVFMAWLVRKKRGCDRHSRGDRRLHRAEDQQQRFQR